MTIDEFFKKWLLQPLDYDKVYGNQCVDVFLAYNAEVVKGTPVSGNAIDYWTRYTAKFYERIDNDVNNYPSKGDVVICGKAIGTYGHIAICSKADAVRFTSFEENWDEPIDGKGVCRYVTHSYYGVLGWLHPKSLPAEPTIEPTEGGVAMSDELRKELDDIRHDLQNIEQLKGTIHTSLTGWGESFVTNKEFTDYKDSLETLYGEKLEEIKKQGRQAVIDAIQEKIDEGVLAGNGASTASDSGILERFITYVVGLIKKA